MDIKDVKFEIEKINPEKDDIILVKIPDDQLNGVNGDILFQMAAKLKEEFKNPVIVMGDKIELSVLSDKQLKRWGLQKIEAA